MLIFASSGLLSCGRTVAAGEGEGEGEDCGNGDPCSTGIGACRVDGLVTCVDSEAVACSAVPGRPLAENDSTADGIDDDCDGDVDEDTCQVDPLRETVCRAGIGACQAAGTLECVRNGLVCNAVPGEPAANDRNNNDIDDDCDGDVDEDVLPCEDQPQFNAACTTGIGACAVDGLRVCSADGQNLECNAVANEPRVADGDDDNRDGIDDDCDGEVDEDDLYPEFALCDPTKVCCFDNVYTAAIVDENNDGVDDRFFHVDEPRNANRPLCSETTPTNCSRPACSDVFGQANRNQYASNPPVSGPHFGCGWGVWNTDYTETDYLSHAWWMHNVEHGGIVFLHGPSATDAQRLELLAAKSAITALARCGSSNTLTISAYDPFLTVPVAVVAAQRMLLPDVTGSIPRARGIEFANACRDHGPEKLCTNAAPRPLCSVNPVAGCRQPSPPPPR